ncbi:MAG: hypothetical protein J7L50_00810 [Candidatus Odinarchaeota archaeon]|nr:hypothetical protein [Candidatus Odinarchaeota archaeon]
MENSPGPAFWNLIPLHSVSFQPSDIYNVRATARNFNIEQLMFKPIVAIPPLKWGAFWHHFCKKHYKMLKKESKKMREIEKLRFGP